ncbi:hypothetical protein EJ02DRAFT_452360 [Clathrospora elynae]|uniref:Uncharacterized protein n=1 Tax=Clathrospora elynae TaxID=706981 RepID=A0A6A5T5Z9_9PLEO|nr:hypothetical protein EJ02DRAFT_452360 [Clathrospora elynae]
MSPTKQPRLTRSQLVTIITDYYVFLTKFYISPSALKYPPPEGWPNITVETTKDLDKAPIVIDLIKHLPYIDEAQANEMVTNIHYKSDVVDYSVLTPERFADEIVFNGEEGLRWWVEDMEREKKESEEENDESQEEEDEEGDDEDDEENSPADETTPNWWDGDNPDNIILPNMIVLAKGYESGGRDIILDVFKAVIHEDMIRCNLLPSVEIAAFFHDLRCKLESLKYVPVPGDDFYEDVPELDKGEDLEVRHLTAKQRDEMSPSHVSAHDAKQYQKIYRWYGWPGEAYNKEGALVAIEEYRRCVRECEDEVEEWQEQGRANMATA